MSYKKFVLLSLLLPLPIILALVILLFIYDPLRLYHKPWFRDDTYHNDMRTQAKNIIDNEKFDSILIGSSMLENTSAKEASKKLNAKFVNLSAGGSVFKERAIILNYLLKHRKIKNIIYSLDGYSLVNLDNNRTFKHYEYLYDDNLYNDFKIYINKKFIFCALSFSKSKKCVGKTNDLEILTSWYEENKKHFDSINNWNEKSKNHLIKEFTNIKNEEKYIDLNIKENKKYIDDNIITFIKQNPNINFYIIIPTYSRLFYKINKYTEYKTNKNVYYSIYKKSLIYLIQECEKYKNVKIYGFDDLDYADNIANYKDLAHYNIDMNSMQLDAIKNDTNRLTPQNIDKYFQIMEEKIKAYDIKPILKQIKDAGL